MEQEWAERFDRYRVAHPALAAEFTRRIHGEFPGQLERDRRSVHRRAGGQGRDRGDPQGIAAGARKCLRQRCPS
jgi:transketolase